MAKYLITALVLVSGLVYGSEPKGPRQIVDFIFEKARDPAIAKDVALQQEVNKYVDFSTVSKNVLGKRAGSTPKPDLEWFKTTLQEIITLSVYPGSPDFFKDVTVSGTDVILKKNAAIVKSVIKKKNDETEVVCHFAQTGGKWLIVDMSLDDESWTLNIKEQVENTLKKEKWDGLKKRLNNKLAKLKLENK